MIQSFQDSMRHLFYLLISYQEVSPKKFSKLKYYSTSFLLILALAILAAKKPRTTMVNITMITLLK